MEWVNYSVERVEETMLTDEAKKLIREEVEKAIGEITREPDIDDIDDIIKKHIKDEKDKVEGGLKNFWLTYRCDFWCGVCIGIMTYVLLNH